MKLFQIEEPEGGAVDPDAPGAAVGIDIASSLARVAIAVGGNAEILPDGDGSPTLDATSHSLDTILMELRARAERQLARPVTHAVIAADIAADAIERAAAAAGVTVLRLLRRQDAAALAKGSPADDAAVHGAAQMAEELAPAPHE
jgi:hypothetical protein